MDFLLYIGAGAAVGFIVGMTGIGGGALMTPLLLSFGFPAHTAVGTDLLYAALTKAGGAYSHHRQKHVNWGLVKLLAAGSIPAALIVLIAAVAAADIDKLRVSPVAPVPDVVAYVIVVPAVLATL